MALIEAGAHLALQQNRHTGEWTFYRKIEMRGTDKGLEILGTLSASEMDILFAAIEVEKQMCLGIG